MKVLSGPLLSLVYHSLLREIILTCTSTSHIVASPLPNDAFSPPLTLSSNLAALNLTGYVSLANLTY